MYKSKELGNVTLKVIEGGYKLFHGDRDFQLFWVIAVLKLKLL